MPRLSDTMTEGTVARWLKQEGDRVEKGDILLEIETDKATMELEAYESGVVEQVLVQEGETVPIGKPIARIGAGNGKAAAPKPGPAQKEQRQPSAKAAEAPPAPGDQEPADQPQPGEGGTPALPEDDEVRASPMARRIARERGIDLHTIEGSGPGGRIIRADVESAPSGDGAAPVPGSAGVPPAAAPRAAEQSERGASGTSGPPSAAGLRPAAPRTGALPGDQEVEELPLSNIRRVTGRRMVESMQSAPHFFLTAVVDVTELVALRAQINDRLAAAGDETKVSINDLIVKACGLTLRAHPYVNVSFAEDKILQKKRIHVGVAVALDNGLIVPVVRDVDQKSLGQVAREAKALIDRARAGKLAPADYTGGTFTVSNLGMFGVQHFTAVINPPEAAILAVGAVAAEPTVRDGNVEVRERMRLTLSVDHRALDGAGGARFLQALKTLLESPMRILV